MRTFATRATIPMTDLERSHAELRAAVRLAGRRIRKLQFGRRSGETAGGGVQRRIRTLPGTGGTTSLCCYTEADIPRAEDPSGGRVCCFVTTGLEFDTLSKSESIGNTPAMTISNVMAASASIAVGILERRKTVMPEFMRKMFGLTDTGESSSISTTTSDGRTTINTDLLVKDPEVERFLRALHDQYRSVPKSDRKVAAK